MNDPQLRRKQSHELGIRPLLVTLRVARNHDRFPAELGQILCPQPRTLSTDQIAGKEVAAYQGNAAGHRHSIFALMPAYSFK